jgi:HAMP domain-containing protein
MNGSEVIGALFVGTPQASVDGPLRTALASVKVAEHGYLTVLASDGSWVVPPPGGGVGSALAATDASGKPYAQRLVAAGASLATGAVGWERVDLPQAGAAKVEISRYAPWGWTIAAWGFDADLRAVPDRLDAGAQNLVRTLPLAGLGVAALAVAFVVWTSGRIVARVGRLTDALRRVAARNLSVDVGGEGSDEIGVMGDAVGEAIEGMRGAVGRMQAGADAMHATAGRLGGSSGVLEDVASKTVAQADGAAHNATVSTSTSRPCPSSSSSRPRRPPRSSATSSWRPTARRTSPRASRPSRTPRPRRSTAPPRCASWSASSARSRPSWRPAPGSSRSWARGPEGRLSLDPPVGAWR